MNQSNLVLASGSSYRKALLGKLNLDFIVDYAEIDESALEGESPGETAMRLAQMKARVLAAKYPAHLVIGSDQVAMLGQRQLKKPGGRESAIGQLVASSGRQVDFYTAVSVFDSANRKVVTDLDVTRVHFKSLTRGQIERYIDLDKPYRCAGSFKSEGLGIALIERIEGEDPNALIGLPLIKLIGILEKFGVMII
ncbi:MAG: Maf family protein [Gammaproteobacteria bacterium]